MAGRPESGRQACRDLYPAPLGLCEYEGGCDAEATDRHHIDEDTWNNERENIALLCRRHHMVTDGRMKNLKPQEPWKQPVPCTNCERKIKVTRRGRCGACNEYLRRTGVERPVDPGTGQVLVFRGLGRVPFGWRPGELRPESALRECEHCGKVVRGGRFAKGRCKRCYEYRRLRGYDRPLASA